MTEREMIVNLIQRVEGEAPSGDWSMEDDYMEFYIGAHHCLCVEFDENGNITHMYI